jgi:hypothetical protein
MSEPLDPKDSVATVFLRAEEPEDKNVYWYNFTFWHEDQNFKSVQMGSCGRKSVNEYAILAAKAKGKIFEDAVLISVSFLGAMPEEQFRFKVSN